MTDDKVKPGLSVTRRNLLKALVSIPVFGAFVISFFDKKLQDDIRRQMLMEELGVSESGPNVIQSAISRPPGKKLRLGIIGFGGEGESLVRHAGFAHPEWIEDARKGAEEDFRNRGLQTFMEQEDLNIELTAVCDVFDVRAQRGLDAVANKLGPTAEGSRLQAKRFLRYTEMLESDEVDAVLIATPDHWHAVGMVHAAQCGKHVYVEKPVSHDVSEGRLMSRRPGAATACASRACRCGPGKA